MTDQQRLNDALELLDDALDIIEWASECASDDRPAIRIADMARYLLPRVAKMLKMEDASDEDDNG